MADDKKIIFSMVGVSKVFPPQKQVLKNIYLSFFYGAKIGIIGLNGSGKSTLLKIIAGVEKEYQGEVVFSPGYSVGYLEQEPKLEPGKTVKEVVQEGVQNIVDTLKEYEEVNEKFGDPEILEDPDKMDALINRQAELQDKIDATDAWNLDSRLERAMDALRCPPEDQVVDTLSGGERRRVALCRLLLQQPDILLLDEPTNHIDNETVRLLEEQLLKYRGAIVMVTHDRYFLNRITRKIVEVDRGKIFEYEGNYSTYLEQKAQREVDAEAKERKNRSLYRQELEWIRRGVRARGTKSKDRIARFHELENREKPAEAEKMQLQSVSSRLGKKTVEIHAITKAMNGRVLIHDFSYQLPRDARIGIVGQNGAGKSTLIKMLCGQISPDNGSIELGDTVRIGYFSQECESMDPNQRVIDYIRETAERIQTPDGTVTAATMLERFLFTSELQWNRIEKLSGGERKRLYLLKVLMTAPNVLLLDEPTNDLDIATLTILEDYLRSFQGAVLAISHDRYFLDKMASEIWELTGNGEVRRYNGNYQDYMEKALPENATEKPKKQTEKKERVFNGRKKLKFSFKEQREYDTIDDEIADLEEQIRLTETEITASVSDYVKLQELSDRKEELEVLLAEKMERWVYLNDLAERIANGEME